MLDQILPRTARVTQGNGTVKDMVEATRKNHPSTVLRPLLFAGCLQSLQKMMDPSSHPFKEGHLALPLSMSLSSNLQVVSQAPQHFRSSEKQAACEWCFARQSICLVISLADVHHVCCIMFVQHFETE